MGGSGAIRLYLIKDGLNCLKINEYIFGKKKLNLI